MTAAGVMRLCAEHELIIAVRSRWLQVFAGVFGVLVLLVSISGYILTGGSGVQEFSRIATSLAELVLLIVPLTAIAFGVTQLTPERGAAELIFAQPVSRGAVLMGRLAGLFAALALAQTVGFGVAGLFVFARAGGIGVGSYLGVVVSAYVLTAVFLALAAVITAGSSSWRRSRALALGLVVWFGSVVLFDAAVLGLASTLRSGDASRVLLVSVFLNPVDAIRTGALLAIGGTTAFGGASLAFLRFTGGPGVAAVWLIASIAVWTMAPVVLAVRRLKSADI